MPQSEWLELIEFIEKQGFETWLVGGSVRDSLLGRDCHDFDLATRATPEQLRELFSGANIYLAGLRHGSLGIQYGNNYYEITTFRSDGKYSDHRRPDQIFFSKTIDEDLARRDFTMNAIAWHPIRGFHDPFGGEEDLKHRTLRCVGNPLDRFAEDPLRILRGLRFLADLPLQAEEKTAHAMIENRDMLFLIAKERIYAELKRILLGDPTAVMADFKLIFDAIIPELKSMQSHWDRTITRISLVPQDLALRLAALLCDVGRYKKEADPADMADQMSRQILRDLRADNQTILEVTQLIRYHLHRITADEYTLRSWLNKLGEDLFRKLLALQRADAIAREHEPALNRIEQCYEKLEEALTGKVAYSLRNLSINGNDLVALGFKPGLAIGLILDRLLDEVMQEHLPNERTALIDRAYQLK